MQATGEANQNLRQTFFAVKTGKNRQIIHDEIYIQFYFVLYFMMNCMVPETLTQGQEFLTFPCSCPSLNLFCFEVCLSCSVHTDLKMRIPLARAFGILICKKHVHHSGWAESIVDPVCTYTVVQVIIKRDSRVKCFLEHSILSG
jgi:hypothetical protein